jgi:hypothetical protein
MRDSQIIISVYRKYLETTGELVSILERHYDKLDSNESPELKEKRKEFATHAQKLIEKMHEDVHVLFRISYELRDLEKIEIPREQNFIDNCTNG